MSKCFNYHYPPYNKKFHMNWGFDGESDGYYLNTDSFTINNISYSFSTDQYITHNIREHE